MSNLKTGYTIAFKGSTPVAYYPWVVVGHWPFRKKKYMPENPTDYYLFHNKRYASCEFESDAKRRIDAYIKYKKEQSVENAKIEQLLKEFREEQKKLKYKNIKYP